MLRSRRRPVQVHIMYAQSGIPGGVPASGTPRSNAASACLYFTATPDRTVTLNANGTTERSALTAVACSFHLGAGGNGQLMYYLLISYVLVAFRRDSR